MTSKLPIIKGKTAKSRPKPTMGTNRIQRVMLKPSDLGTMPPRVAAFISSGVASQDFIFLGRGNGVRNLYIKCKKKSTINVACILTSSKLLCFSSLITLFGVSVSRLVGELVGELVELLGELISGSAHILTMLALIA